MSTATILRIGKHNYTCGLFWQIFASTNELRQESVKYAEGMHASHWVVRKAQGVVQAGFCELGKIPAKTRSLAYEIADRVFLSGININGERSIPQNWIGIFSLPGLDDQWAYVAVRNNVILGDGDIVAPFEAIVEKIRSDGGMHWDVVITDDPSSRHFAQFFSGIPHSIFDSLSALEKPVVKQFLVPVKTNLVQRYAKIAIAIAVAFGALKGIQLYKQYQMEKAAEAARREAEARAASVKIVPPWHTQPRLPVAVAACMANFKEIAPGGWELSSYSCDLNSQSTVTSFIANDMPIWSLVESNGTASFDNGRATIAKPLTLPSPTDEQRETILDKKTAIRLFNDLLWRLDIVTNFREEPTGNPVLPGDNTAPPPPPWRALQFSFDTKMLSPQSIVSAIAVPGVRLTKINYEKDTWILEGVLYANE